MDVLGIDSSVYIYGDLDEKTGSLTKVKADSEVTIRLLYYRLDSNALA